MGAVWDYITGATARTAEAQKLSLLELNAAAEARGAISPEVAAQRAALIQETPTGIFTPGEGFRQGLDEGAANVRGTISGAVAGTLGMIPVNVWALVAAAVGLWALFVFGPRLARGVR
jgi:hypothetical protein